jgi:hypothetical protein
LCKKVKKKYTKPHYRMELFRLREAPSYNVALCTFFLLLVSVFF